MAEMGRVSRFFVNRFNSRRNTRICEWIGANVPLTAGRSCLEIGCGNGDLAARLVERLKPSMYVATDLDSRQIDTAKRHLTDRYPGGLPSTLDVREADMLHLPFGDASFDMAVAIVSIHHASPNHHDPVRVPAALAEIGRVLRPGGFLVYEEFLHKELIRSWLTEHGFSLANVQRGFRRESVVARKAGGS